MRKTSQDAKSQLIADIPLFQHCSRRQLSAVAKVATELERPAGTEVVSEGTQGRELFVLIDGAARVERGGSTLAQLGPGDHFGEMSLLDGAPRSASVTLTEDSRLLVIDGRGFLPLLTEIPGFAEKLLVSLSRRLRDVESQAGASI